MRNEDETNIFRRAMDSPGMQIINRFHAHSFSWHIFIGNLDELKEGIRLIEDPELGVKLMSHEHKKAGDQAHRDINRLFHNFLASAMTLVEHTRIFINTHYKGTPIDQAYSKKIQAEFTEDPLCRFVQDLRNYMLHKGLPHSQMSLTFTKENPKIETTISLHSEKLREWSKWHSQSKAFLDRQGPKIKLAAITEDYGNKIISLNTWLNGKLKKYHAKELEEFESMRKKSQEIAAKMNLFQ